MNQILKPKQIVKTVSSNLPCEVEQLLGSGGQGEVYRTCLKGQLFALKWYYPSSATKEQWTALETIIKKGAPTSKFLWPIELVAASAVPGFGYIMPLRDKRYKNIVDLMKRRVEPTFRAMATACFELADSFWQLHSKGLCYRDISFGNVFFEPETGSILICDNDNVTVDGQAVSLIKGTPRFMAPEIVRGEVEPNIYSDLFSLAILMFYMLMVHHPLEGLKEASIHSLDLPAMEKLYGTEPVFIYDPKDRSNRPVPGLHDNAIAFWPIYPQVIRDLFTRSFTEGIRDPQNGRVRETEWRLEMVRLRDSIIYCTCGIENFYDGNALKASGGKPGTCWSCKRELRLPPRMRIGKNIIMLNHDTKLFPHHTNGLYDFDQPIAEVSRNPKEPNIWGLKNLTSDKWVITTADGSIKEIEPERNVPLAVGTKINFGKIEGEIRV